jgi:hypothetical protein
MKRRRIERLTPTPLIQTSARRVLKAGRAAAIPPNCLFSSSPDSTCASSLCPFLLTLLNLVLDNPMCTIVVDESLVSRRLRCTERGREIRVLRFPNLVQLAQRAAPSLARSIQPGYKRKQRYCSRQIALLIGLWESKGRNSPECSASAFMGLFCYRSSQGLVPSLENQQLRNNIEKSIVLMLLNFKLDVVSTIPGSREILLHDMDED